MSSPPPSHRSPGRWLGIGLRGSAMGIAELVPGISGGTVAFITGIYAELVGALARFDRALLQHLMAWRLSKAWRHADMGFLCTLGLGMLIAIACFVNLLHWMLEHYAICLWAFFFGLIFASVVMVARATLWTVPRALLGGLAAATGLQISLTGGLPPSDSLMIMFIAGGISICAWILPGISGSFMLVLLGQYQTLIKALSDLQLAVLTSFVAGCVLGLLCFAHILRWLLTKFFHATVATMCGFMCGSMQTLWPWRRTLSYYIDTQGVPIKSITLPTTPHHFAELYGEDPMLLGATLAAILGLTTVGVLAASGRQRQQDVSRQ